MVAMLVSPGSGFSQAPSQAPVVDSDDVFVLPATVGQQGFWYLDQLQPGNTAYSIAVGVRLQGPLRSRLHRGAINNIVARHESLRTTFSVREGMPVQVIAQQLTIPVPCDDLRQGSDQERRQRAEAQAGQEAQRPFDLASGPLIRTRLLRLFEQEHMLLVTVHHIVADGWSIGIITDELAAFYESECAARPPIYRVSIQCGDYAVLAGQGCVARPSNKPSTDEPARQVAVAGDTHRQAGAGPMAARLNRPCRALTDPLESLATRKSHTLMVMLSAFKIFLSNFRKG